jgi:hypothetical protein
MTSQHRRVVAVAPDAPCIAEQLEIREADGRLAGIERVYAASAERPATLPLDVPFFEGVRMSHYVNVTPDSVAVTYEADASLPREPSLLARLVAALELDGWTVSSVPAPASATAAFQGTRGERQRHAFMLANGDATFFETRRAAS